MLQVTMAGYRKYAQYPLGNNVDLAVCILRLVG